MASHSLPYPTFGAFSGYNTSYSNDGLYSNNYRDLPITSYADRHPAVGPRPYPATGFPDHRRQRRDQRHL